jgi:hypothetical protein
MNDRRKPLLIVEDDPALQTQMKWAFDAYDVSVAADCEARWRSCGARAGGGDDGSGPAAGA